MYYDVRAWASVLVDGPSVPSARGAVQCLLRARSTLHMGPMACPSLTTMTILAPTSCSLPFIFRCDHARVGKNETNVPDKGLFAERSAKLQLFLTYSQSQTLLLLMDIPRRQEQAGAGHQHLRQLADDSEKERRRALAAKSSRLRVRALPSVVSFAMLCTVSFALSSATRVCVYLREPTCRARRSRRLDSRRRRRQRLLLLLSWTWPL